MSEEATDATPAGTEAELSSLRERMGDLETRLGPRRRSTGERVLRAIGLVVVPLLVCLGALTAAGLEPFYIDEQGHLHIAKDLAVGGSAVVTGQVTGASFKGDGAALSVGGSESLAGALGNMTTRLGSHDQALATQSTKLATATAFVAERLPPLHMQIRGDTTKWRQQYKNWMSRCRDADGCRVRLVMQNVANDAMRTIVASVACEQGTGKVDGVRCYLHWPGSGWEFTLNTGVRQDFMNAWNWMWFCNYSHQNVTGRTTSGWNDTDINVLVAPNIIADVTVYD